MNNALIAVVITNKHLMKRSLQISNKIVVVEIDHGETNCKNPNAKDYIIKTGSRKRKK